VVWVGLWSALRNFHNETRRAGGERMYEGWLSDTDERSAPGLVPWSWIERRIESNSARVTAGVWRGWDLVADYRLVEPRTGQSGGACGTRSTTPHHYSTGSHSRPHLQDTGDHGD